MAPKKAPIAPKKAPSAPKIPPIAHNVLQVNFDSVLSSDNPVVVSIFQSLERSGLRRFLGGSTTIYEGAVREFFRNAQVIDSSIHSSVNGTDVTITETIFSDFFQLPSEGLVSFQSIPVAEVSEMLQTFSATAKALDPSGKKMAMKEEYRVLCDIAAKSLAAKAGSFDAYTGERIEVMVAISKGYGIDWSTLIFNSLIDLVNNTTKLCLGFCVQIGELLQHLGVQLGAGKPLNPLKVLTRSSFSPSIPRAVVAPVISVAASSQRSSDTNPANPAARRPSSSGYATKRRKLQMAESEVSSSQPALSLAGEVSSGVATKPSEVVVSSPADQPIPPPSSVPSTPSPAAPAVPAAPTASARDTASQSVLPPQAVSAETIDLTTEEGQAAFQTAVDLATKTAAHIAKKFKADVAASSEREQKAKVLDARTLELAKIQEAARAAEAANAKEIADAAREKKMKDFHHGSVNFKTKAAAPTEKTSRAADQEKQSAGSEPAQEQNVASAPPPASSTHVVLPERRVPRGQPSLTINEPPEIPVRPAEVPGKGKTVLNSDDALVSERQGTLDLILQKVQKSVSKKLIIFDEWSNRRLFGSMRSMAKSNKPDTLIRQEENVKKWTKTKDIQVALKRRAVAEINTRGLKLGNYLRKRVKTYDPNNKTASADVFVNVKLEELINECSSEIASLIDGTESSRLCTLPLFEEVTPKARSKSIGTQTDFPSVVSEQPPVNADRPSTPAAANPPSPPPETVILDSDKDDLPAAAVPSPARPAPSVADAPQPDKEPISATEAFQPTPPSPPKSDAPKSGLVSSPKEDVPPQQSEVDPDLPPPPPPPKFASVIHEPIPVSSVPGEGFIPFGANKEIPERQLTGRTSPPHSPDNDVSSPDIELIIARKLAPVFQALQGIQNQINNLSARSDAFPPDLANELHEVRSDTTRTWKTVLSIETLVKSSVVTQVDLLRSHSEIVTDQIAEMSSKIESVGAQTAELTTFLQDKEEAEASAKKKPPPRKRPAPR